jgi:hypothetical protein
LGERFVPNTNRSSEEEQEEILERDVFRMRANQTASEEDINAYIRRFRRKQ